MGEHPLRSKGEGEGDGVRNSWRGGLEKGGNIWNVNKENNKDNIKKEIDV